MKITLPLSKSDEKSFSSMSQEDDRIPRKPSNKKTHTGTFSHCTSSKSRSRWHGKGDKVGSIIEVSKKQQYV